MKYRTRTFYTDKQKSEMWDRWQRVDSMGSIGRHFNRASSSISPHLARTGGIRPADQTRPRCALSLIALTWLGSEWTKAVELLLGHSDEEIAIANKDNGLLKAIEYASSVTVDAFLTPAEDMLPEDFFKALLDEVVSRKNPDIVAERLKAENW